MTYNPKKPHRCSIRLAKYDYTQLGSYFITICTYKKQCWFGNVVNGIIKLNRLGHIVDNLWQRLPVRFPHIKIDAFIAVDV